MVIFSDGFFSIDSTNGFLPIKEPILKLPARYNYLQKLIDEMPLKKSNGEPGLLSVENDFEKATLSLPNYLNEVRKEKDSFLLGALFLV